MPQCTYCKGTEFFGGPEGGLAQNILCANPKCRHWFNYSPFGMDDLNRIEPSDEEKAAAQAAREQAALAHPAKMQQEGVDLFNAGKSAAACLTTAPYGGYAEAHDNVLRLAGWCDALKTKTTSPFGSTF